MKSSRKNSASAGDAAPDHPPGTAVKFLVVGTAGHIDHGKTELVRALTGVRTDRLKEEQERGITIDLGFADLELDPRTHLAFIDVPGHERFVKNMLAGAVGVDLVLLVVAADESIRPQTREHFDICRLLGIRGGLVAITKLDLIDSDLVELVRLELVEYLRGTFLAGAPIVPVSARTGAGIPALLEAFRAVAARTPPRSIRSTPRLPVDRSFSIKGFGTVVTGTLAGGIFHGGDDLEVLPAGTRAKVRGLQVHRHSRQEARAGQRTAVNLQGIEKQQVGRGDVLAPIGVFAPSHLFDLRVELLPSAPTALRNLGRVRFHHGTSEIMGRVKLLEGPELPPGGAAFAQVRLEKPLVAVLGDRFILRRYSPPTTIGGGVILDNAPAKHRGYPAAVVRHLERLADPEADTVLLAAIEAAPAGGGTAPRLRRLTGRLETDIEDRLQAQAKAGTLHRLATRPPCYLVPSVIEGLHGAVVELLQAYHRDNPLSPGLSREEIRTRLFAAAPPEFFRTVLQELTDAGRVRLEKDVVCLGDHEIRLQSDEADLEAILDAEFRDGALSPPTLKDIVQRRGVEPRKAEKIFYLLLQRGKLVRLDGGMVFHSEALEALKSILWKYRESSDRIDVGAFKDLTGTTRKSAIPLLEHLDRTRVTRREGNVRVILPPPGTGGAGSP